MKRLQILGTGCPKCRKLAENAEAAAKAAGIAYTLEKVTDITEILKFKVMMTPALAVDGQVKVAGRVPSPEEIKDLLASRGAPGGRRADPAGQKPPKPGAAP